MESNSNQWSRHPHRLPQASIESALASFTLLERSLFPWMRNAPHESATAAGMLARTAGAGIVLTTGSAYAPVARLAITVLRHVGSRLPVEIAFCGNTDLDTDARDMLGNLPDVALVDMSPLMGAECSSGWQLKPWAVLASSFRQVILMDADTLFFQPPEAMFSFPSFMSTGALLFRDRTLEYGLWGGGPGVLELLLEVSGPYATDLLFSTSRVASRQSCVEIDSGVVVWDKDRAMAAIMLACLMNTEPFRSRLYAKTYGDKESFWFAHEALRLPFGLGRGNGGSIGELDTGTRRLCGHLFHPDDSMRPLWMNGGVGHPRHRTADPEYILSLEHWAVEETGNVKWGLEREPFCLIVQGDVVHAPLNGSDLETARLMERLWIEAFVDESGQNGENG
ncbi:mannosyltransferase putative-domain-containing protein [Entophlyctis helioformis]|nr:mannosyltransferase putative-domain-containing protein [Entophlyctis helioformis]